MIPLSEAIKLGSTIVKPKAGQQFNIQEKAGCAIGMANLAIGCTYGPRDANSPKWTRSEGLNDTWAWTDNIVVRPCKCFFNGLQHESLFLMRRLPRNMAAKDVITHLFDRHVFGRRDWTIDKLTAWVESVEPKEPTIGIELQSVVWENQQV